MQLISAFLRGCWPRPTVALLTILLWAGVAPAHGQSLTHGRLAGSVEDSVEVPLHDVRVGLQERSTGYTRSLVTGRNGRFSFGLVPAGVYELRVERIGYRPTSVQRIAVSPGAGVDVPVRLTRSVPPVERVDTIVFAAAAGSAMGGARREFSALELRGFPERRRELTELARLSSWASDDFGVDGLPASMSGVRVDGIYVQPSPWFSGWSTPLSAAALPLGAFDGARLVAGHPDVERAGIAGGALEALTRRGTREFGVESFGSWSHGNLASAGAVDPTTGSLRDLQGGVLIGGPVFGDTARFVAGVELWNLESPPGRGWGSDSLAREIAGIARDSFGVSIDVPSDAHAVRSEVVSLFGRLDWQLAPAHSLSIGTNAALVGSSAAAGGAAAFPVESSSEGRDLLGHATLLSNLSGRVLQELRIAFQSGSRQTAGAGEAEPIHTRILESDLAFGSDGRGAGRYTHSLAQAAATWHLDLGAHRAKLGISGALPSYERDPMGARWREFRFAGPEEFARGEGSFVQAVGAAPSSSFSVPRLGISAQNSWTAAPGLELIAGARYDLELLPVHEVTANQAWMERTGLSATDVDSRPGTFSPRVGFVWTQGRGQGWVMDGAAGVYAGYADPRVLGDLLANDGRVALRRGDGILHGWPDLLEPEPGAEASPGLTLLARGFRGPRTLRGSLGVSRYLGAGTRVRVEAAYRQTDQLARGADLNLAPAPSAQDQFGRPVFGVLRQHGSVLAVEPGSNRRFPDFDRVSAINLDGWSDRRALTVMVDRDAADWLSLFGSYTLSRTTDNWLSAGDRPDLALDPLPGSAWAEGTSDLDVPHRLSTGAEIRIGAARLAGLYRYRSGRPFTPGFSDGVDANGDGSAGNDPAFVSESVPGIESLLAQWPCLREQLESFAQRNSCRAEGAHSLEARLALGLARLGRHSTEIFVDGLNLIEPGIAIPDRALYLVDPAGSLGSAADGTVTVPLIANEAFGTPLVRFRTGRQLRIGFRISH